MSFTNTIIICKAHFTLRGLNTAARNVGNMFNIPVVDTEDYKSNYNLYKNNDIIFEGWIDSYMEIIKLSTCRKYVRWQSPITQSELSENSVEILLFLELLQLKSNDIIQGIFVSDFSLSECYPDHVSHFPNIFKSQQVSNQISISSKSSVGVIMTYTPRKNISSNLLCAKLLDDEVVLSSNIPSNYYKFCEESDIRCKVVDLTVDETYNSTISTLKLSLQVTLSESLNYGITDAIFNGTAVICSHNTPIVGVNKTFDSMCAVDRVDSPSAIYEKAIMFYRSENYYHDFISLGLEVLDNYNQTSMSIINDLLFKYRFT